jgi:primosomal protein N'
MSQNSPSARAWARNFSLIILCNHCGTQLKCDQPVVSNEKNPTSHRRHVVAFAPESCPDCSSLHTVLENEENDPGTRTP